MKRILFALLLVPWTPAAATGIAGKWGIGVGTGSLLGSSPEVSLIRGTSPATAWILDLSATVRSDHATSSERLRYPYAVPQDTTLRSAPILERWGATIGPRLRHYFRPEETFAAYGDLFLHGTYLGTRNSGFETTNDETRYGGELGFDFGVEYFFTRWPVSLAAHTPLASVRVEHTQARSHGYGRDSNASGTSKVASAGLSPRIFLRVYF